MSTRRRRATTFPAGNAASVDPARLPTAERHSRYLVDTARAWHRQAAATRLANGTPAPGDNSVCNLIALEAALSSFGYTESPTPVPA